MSRLCRAQQGLPTITAKRLPHSDGTHSDPECAKHQAKIRECIYELQY